MTKDALKGWQGAIQEMTDDAVSPSAKPLGASKSETAPGSVDLGLATVEALEFMAKKWDTPFAAHKAIDELARRAKQHSKIGGHDLLKKGQRVHVDVPEGSKNDGTVMHDWDHSMFYVRLHLDGRPEGQVVSVCRKYVQLIAQEK